MGSRSVYCILFVLLIVCVSFYPAKDSFTERRPYSCNIGIGIGLNLTRIEIVDAPMKYTKASMAKSIVPANAKLMRMINLVTQFAAVNVLIMCNDIDLNPGPVSDALVCTTCSKLIEKNQPRTNCFRCKSVKHLKCLKSCYDVNRICQQCSVGMNDNISDDGIVYSSQVIMKMNDIFRASGVKILHQNIRSLLSKIDELRLFISGIQSKVGLFTLSEIWLMHEIADVELGIEGYAFHRRDRGSKERSGGLGIYVRNDPLISRFDLEQSDIESLWVEVHSPSPADFWLGYFINLLNRLGIIMMHLWIILRTLLRKLCRITRKLFCWEILIATW